MGSHVEEIKGRLHITDVVGSYIQLEKAGQNYKARCPFHNEKTPSFYVSPERGSYYCFGCHAKGDIFSFVEQFEGIDFMGALRILAERAGVRLTPGNWSKDSKKELFLKILEDATSFYEDLLAKHNEALAYLEGRGLKKETIEAFRIGYVPTDWRLLRNHLREKGYRDEDVLSTGLIKRSEKDSRDQFYDTFRGRIMFPISDSSGRVVAFTGRTLDENSNPPKYLNSPETALFQKSKILYGLDRAKSDIRKRGYSILVEGQMDLIMLHQAGWTNVVAASGTAFTDDDGQDSAFGLLKRLSDNIVLAFDADSAGQKAVKRLVPILSLGMNVKILDIHGGKDPADIVKNDPRQWTKLLEGKRDFIEYLAHSIDARSSSTDKIRLLKQDVFPYLSLMTSETARAQAIQVIANTLSLKEDALWHDFKEYHKTRPNKSSPKTESAPNQNRDRADLIERKILGLLYSDKYFKGDDTKRLLIERAVGHDRWKALSKISREDIAEYTLEAEVSYGDSHDIDREWRELLYNLEEEHQKKRLTILLDTLHRAERDKRTKDAEEAMREIDVVSRRIQELKKLLTSL